jgi:hypothetical protein
MIPVDSNDVAKGDEEVERLDFGATYILPGIKRKLIHARCCCCRRSYPVDEALNQFNIEDPPALKDARGQFACISADAEDLGSALRIVNR